MEEKQELEIGIVMIRGCRCRCGHEWRPHNINERPAVCPKCKAANWDKPKRNPKHSPRKEH